MQILLASRRFGLCQGGFFFLFKSGLRIHGYASHVTCDRRERMRGEFWYNYRVRSSYAPRPLPQGTRAQNSSRPTNGPTDRRFRNVGVNDFSGSANSLRLVVIFKSRFQNYIFFSRPPPQPLCDNGRLGETHGYAFTSP